MDVIGAMDDFLVQIDLYKRLHAWMCEAQDVATGFCTAGIPLPHPLSVVVPEGAQNDPQFSDRLPVPEEKPSGTPADWIWIPHEAMTPTTAAVGVLRDNPKSKGNKISLKHRATGLFSA